MISADTSTWLIPGWPAHPRVAACVTTRCGDLSPPPWQGFNLGANCDDDPGRVARARELVRQALHTETPVWLTQVHGTHIVDADQPEHEADGCIVRRAGLPCVVLTADCLPVLMARRDGSAVGAFHAGWRGLLDGILEQGARRLAPRGEALDVWLGPAICQGCYQVDDSVRNAFTTASPEAADAFLADGPGHWRMDLFMLACQRLAGLRACAIYGGEHCTHCRSDLFYSFRHEGQTGRFASLIWLKD